MTLKEILADKTQFADNVVFTLATGQTVTLGDLRSLSASDQAALTKREADIAQKTADLEKQLKTLQLAQQETARMFAEVQAEKEKLTGNHQPQPDPLEALERDPVLGPMARVIKQQQSAIADLSEKRIKPIADTMANMAKAYLDDQLDQRYAALIPADKQSEYPLEKLLQVANDQKFMTRGQMPDIRRAYQHLTTTPVTAADLDAKLKAAREEGVKAGEQKAREAAALRVPRPGFNSGAPQSGGPEVFKAKNQSSVSAALDEALAAAAKDSSIWTSVDGQLN